MKPRENAGLVLHTVSAETPTGRASRRAAEDVIRLGDELEAMRDEGAVDGNLVTFPLDRWGRVVQAMERV